MPSILQVEFSLDKLMHHHPCVVIPLYKQLEAIEATLQTIHSYDLPCLLIDDGNQRDVREFLSDLVERFPRTQLYSLDCNQGKGAAVQAGFRLAAELGYSHALQVDADGQHDLSQIPVMMGLSKENPQALIAGHPVFDESVNKLRFYARQLTHFLVKLHTLSWGALDTMCGYRVYPLDASCRLMDRVRVGRRMDFDTDIMVRLIWDGVPVVKHKTKVIYPENGQSNFDYLHDNILITKMHARLLLGMLSSLPARLFKGKARAEDEQVHWSEIQEVGSLWPMRLLVWGYKIFGTGFFKAAMWPVIAYYYKTHHKARNASRQYLERVYRVGSQHPELQRRPDWRTSFKHLLQFGYSNVDRVASWLGQMKLTDLHFHQKDEFLELHARGQGAIIISSHLGNIEMCRALITQFPGVKMHILMHTQHATKFNRILSELNDNADLGIIQVNKIGPETALFLQERIEAGEYVVILGDRTPVRARERVVEVEFLGEKTKFPQGPYVMAHLLECPVYVMFCLAEQGRYCLTMEKFADQIKLSRKNRDSQLQVLAQQYARILESYCLREPLQWFNFYDFWDTNDVGADQERHADKAS